MAIRFDKIQLTGSNTNHEYPQLWNVSGEKVTIQSSHGYIRLGSGNASYGHIETDRASFYFNKAVSFDGNIAGYGGDETASFATYYDSNNTSYYVNPAGTSVMNDIEIEDHIYHKGDTNTWIQFETDVISLRTGGTDRLTLTNSSATFANNVRIPVAWDSGTLENNAIYAKNSTDGFGMGNGTGISTWWAWSTENGLKRMIDCANSGDYVTLRTANTDRVSITSSGLSLQNSGDIDVGNIRIVGDNDSSDQGKAWMRSNGDYLVLNAVDGEHVYLNWDTGGGGSGHVYVQDRVYAMSFFDRNDTNYYLDPNGQSRLHSLNLGSSPASGVTAGYIAQIRGSIHMTNNEINHLHQVHFNDNLRFYEEGNNNYLNFRWGSTANGGMVFRDGDNAIQGYVYGSGSGTFGILDKDGSWTLITDGATYTALRANDNEELIVYTNRVEIPGDIRAPYFYDRDDTSYYVNPAGTTNINTLISVDANASTLSASVGVKSPNQRTNYAAHRWAVGNTNPQLAAFDGNFSMNGGTSENSITYREAPSGGRGLVWIAENNDSASGADGGWEKTISNLNDDKAYISIVYVKRVGTSTNGSFYHGCNGSHTLNLNGTANTNPYFTSFNIGTLPQDVWCVSIGIIQANNDSNTASWDNLDGVYRLDTGERIVDSTTFKMKDGSTTQTHRTYLYYSTDSNAELQWYNPGFYEINGQEPSLNEILNRDKHIRSTGNLNVQGDFGTIDLGSGSSSIKKTAGGTNGNHAAVELYSSGTADSGSAIAIQQQTSEGDTILFADYEPHVEWGISTENSNNEIQFTAGQNSPNMGSKTLYNNAGTARTAYKKMIFVLGSGTMSVAGDVRAPIFYDLDNTGYYLNPAAGSKMVYLGLAADPNTSGSYTLNMGGSIDMNNNNIHYVNELHFYDGARFFDTGNDSYLAFKWDDSNAGGIRFQNGGNTIKGYVYGDNGGFGLLDSDGHWTLRSPTGGAGLELRSNDNVEFTVNNDHTLSHGSSRAPIFYDSDDTGYYLDPAGTSHLNTIQVNDYIYHKGDTNTYIYFQSDSIKLRTGGDDRLHITNTVTTATNSVKITSSVGGKLHLRSTDTAIASGDYIGNLYFEGVDSGGVADNVGVMIHAIATDTWNNTQAPTKLLIKTRSASGLADALTLDQNQNAVFGGSVYVNALYDTSDTNYYLNPASFSKINYIAIGVHPANIADVEYGNLRVSNNGSGESHMGNGSIAIQLGPNTTRAGTSAPYYGGIAWNGLMNYGGNNTYDAASHVWVGAKYHDTPGSERSYFVVGVKSETNNSNDNTDIPVERFSIDYSGNAIATGSYRAPIFYDSADTTYYLDPASTSTGLKTAGEAEVKSLKLINGFALTQGGSNYANVNSWMYLQNNTGLYAPANSAHIYPNATSDYGAWRMDGARNNWNGITFAHSGIFNTLMSNNVTMGLYNDSDNEWYLEGARNSYLRLYYNGTEQARTDNGFFLANNQMRSPIFYDSADTTYYLDPAGTSTSLATAGKWFMQGSHSSARIQLNYAHGSSPATDSNSSALTAWVSEPGITYNGAGIGVNIHVNGQYYGRAYDTQYGAYIRFDKSVGAIEGWTTTGTAGTSGGQGTKRWHSDNGGNFYGVSSLRAPIFYDSDDTTYYLNPSSSTSLNVAGSILSGAKGHVLGANNATASTAVLELKSVSGAEQLRLTDGNSLGTSWSPFMSFYDGDGNRRGYVQGTGTSASAMNMRVVSQYGSFSVYTNASGGTTERLLIGSDGNAIFRGQLTGESYVRALDAYQIVLDAVHSGGPVIEFGATNDHDQYGSIGHQGGEYQFGTHSRDFAWYNGTTRIMELDAGNTSEPVLAIGTSVAADNTKGTLQVFGNNNTDGTVRLGPHSSKGSTFSHIHYGSNGDWYIRPASNSGSVFVLNYSAISDERLKENIVDSEYGLSEITSLRPRNFNWIDSSTDDVHTGFVAQEVEAVVPKWITQGELDDHKSVDYNAITSTLVKAVQELKAQNEDLLNRVKALENK